MIPFRLTAPRKRIFELLSEFHYLATKDFYRLLRGGTPAEQRAIRFHLQRLRIGGFINCQRWVDYEIEKNYPPYENVYWFSKKGYDLAAERGFSGVFNDEKSPYSLGHELALTRFHVTLKRLCENRGLELYWRQTNLKKTIHPDALLGVTFPNLPAGKNTYPYFLEIERSKQGHYNDGESGLVRKLAKYHDYQRSTACKEDWAWFSQFRVLIVVKNQDRQFNLLSVLSSKLPDRMFWITTQDADLSQRIFLTPKDYTNTAYSLVE